MTEQEQIDKAVSRLAKLLEESEIGTVRRVHIDFQESGQHPYRVEIEEDEYPVIGQATT